MASGSTDRSTGLPAEQGLGGPADKDRESSIGDGAADPVRITAFKPFSMAALGWFFVGYSFRPYMPADRIDSYIAGLIVLAAAPCTAMVFVWSNPTKGEPHFALSQVALDDAIMVVAFAPDSERKEAPRKEIGRTCGCAAERLALSRH